MLAVTHKRVNPLKCDANSNFCLLKKLVFHETCDISENDTVSCFVIRYKCRQAQTEAPFDENKPLVCAVVQEQLAKKLTQHRK